MNLHPLSSKYVWLAPSPATAKDLDALGSALLFYDGEKGGRRKGGVGRETERSRAISWGGKIEDGKLCISLQGGQVILGKRNRPFWFRVL